MTRFRVTDFELEETFEPIKRAPKVIRRPDRSRTAQAKQTSQTRRAQRQLKAAS